MTDGHNQPAVARFGDWIINLPWGGEPPTTAQESTRRRLMVAWAVIVLYEISLVSWILGTRQFGELSRIPLSTTGLLLYISILLGIVAMVALRFFSTRVVGQLLEARAQAMRVARDASEQATQAKSAFLANMSHEIRTPLNAVIGMSNILADSKLNDTQAQQVNVIHTSGRHLLTLINDILDFSKIEAGKLELEKAPMSIRRCIEESLDLCAGKAFEKDLALTYHIADDVPDGIIGDIGRLRQIIVNLTSNAVKFTENGGVKILVTTTQKGEREVRIKIAVQDTGIGIEPAVQKRLFTAFQQADASTTRQFGGTGLGLAITRMLTEEMGGDVGLESEVGKGSTFSVEFPTRVAKVQQRAPWQGGAMELKGKIALVVDDHSANIEMLEHHLKKWGVTTLSTMDAKQAMKWLKSKPVDICILDQIMPTKGTELARSIRKAKPKVPVIIATSETDITDAPGNVVAIIAKPIKPSDIYDGLVKALLDAGHGPKMQAPSVGFDESLGVEHPLRILIAEDAVHNQMVAVASLNKFGYDPDLAVDGVEAVDMCKKNTYDLVFMDLQMPNLDGYEATRQITSVPNHPRIVGLSAHVGAEEREKCASVGMDGYLSKPFAVADLRRVLVETKSPAAPAPKANGKVASKPTNSVAKAKSKPKASNSASKVQCAAETASGKPCSRPPRKGSKYCASHKGYRPKRAKVAS